MPNQRCAQCLDEGVARHQSPVTMYIPSISSESFPFSMSTSASQLREDVRKQDLTSLVKDAHT